MSIVVVADVISEAELELAKEEYGEYVKVVVDVERGILTAGGEWHADGEKVLLEQGSEQKNLWGGGLDLVEGQVDYVSLINTRPNLNNSQEVADQETRRKMLEIITKVFESYVKAG